MGKISSIPKPTQDGSVEEEDKTKNPTEETDLSNVKKEGSTGIHMPVEEGGQDQRSVTADAKTGGLIPEIQKMLKTHWKKFMIGLVVFVIILLLCGGSSGAMIYRLVHGMDPKKAELQQKLSAAGEVNKLQLDEVLKLQLQLSSTLEIKNMEIVVLNMTIKSNILLLQGQRKVSAQLRKQNNLIRSILRSDKVSVIWGFCNETTRQCARCPTGWKEHDSHCFYLFPEEKEWQQARMGCRDYGGDLAVVSDAEDQAFLTNLTLDFVLQHPNVTLKAAWIGLNDMIRSNDFRWIDGSKLDEDVSYWVTPPNVIPTWDEVNSGLDCIGIHPLNLTVPNWLNNWDDITCRAERHYICETEVLVI